MRVIIVTTVGFLMLLQPAFAQGGKKPQKSCAEVCIEYCQKNAAHRNFCMNECPGRCEARRAQKK